MKDKEWAIKELKNAINYLDKEYSCDDRDLKCPNPDSLSIALNCLLDTDNELSEYKKYECRDCAVGLDKGGDHPCRFETTDDETSAKDMECPIGNGDDCKWVKIANRNW